MLHLKGFFDSRKNMNIRWIRDSKSSPVVSVRVTDVSCDERLA